MKKLIVKRKWKQYLASRSRSQLKAKANFAAHRRERRIDALGQPHNKVFKQESRLAGPRVFSLIQNPNGTIEFFNKLESISRKRNVFVDLSKVMTLTPDAIALLVAMIPVCSRRGARIIGNTPLDDRAKRMLNDSGFRRYVRSAPGSEDLVRTAPMGQIAKRIRTGETVQDRFDQLLARDLIEFGTLKLNGRPTPHGPTYGVLCEGMLNTLNHAGESKRSRQPWWASVYVDAERNRACFTFIDLGVGIFKSHQLTVALQVKHALRLVNRAELLRRIFRGEIQSTTREPGRGNGLPGMYEHCKAGRIRDFTVIANDAIGKAEFEAYEVLSDYFPGTLLYWEIEK